MEEANAMHSQYEKIVAPSNKDGKERLHSNWTISDTDVKYIIRAASIIVRSLNTVEDEDTPYNVYLTTPKPLSHAMLDYKSKECGEYLLLKYCNQQGIMLVNLDELQDRAKVLCGPKELVSKVLKGSSTTVSRNRCHPTPTHSVEEKQTSNA